MAARLGKLLMLSMLVACGAPRAVERSAAPAGIAFVDVTVIPMDAERRLPHQTVLVVGDRIAAVGPVEQVALGRGVQRIDGRGRFLMPGLADMHTHLDSTASLLLFVANGVTTVRNMAGAPVHLVWRDRVARGELLGPTIYTAGPIIDGPRPFWSGSIVVETADEAAAAVAAQQRTGYDFVKVYGRLSRPAFDAVVAAARRAGMPVAGHVPGAVGIEHALDAGLTSVEHLGGYEEAAEADDSPVRGKSGYAAWLQRGAHISDDKIARLAQRTAASGTWNCPTLVTGQRSLPASELAAFERAPELRFVPPVIRASWDPTRDFRLKSSGPELFARLRQSDAIHERIVAALARAGAHLVLGTDEPNPFVVPGFSVHVELANLVRAGLTPYQALRAATVEAAALVRDPAAGTIAPGQHADLLLLEADPLVDTSNAARRLGVMARGRWLTQAELASRLEALAQSYRPAADRFAGRSPLTIDGAAPRTATYRISFNDVAMGSERIAVARDAQGRTVMRGQLATDAPDPLWYDARVRLDGEGALDELELASARPDGAGELDARRQGAGWRLRGRLPVVGAIDGALGGDGGPLVRGAFDGGNFLDGPEVLDVMVLAPWFAALAPGESKELDVQSLQLDPAYAIWPGKLKATRHDDGEVTLEFTTRAARVTRHVRLDGDGLVASVRLEAQIGEYRVERVR